MNHRFFVSLILPLVAWATASVSAAGVDPEQGILIEAEDFAEKHSTAEDFARPTRETTASQRRVLVSFHRKGHVLYRFGVPADADYTGWLRYAANRATSIGVDVDPPGEPKLTRAKLPATGGLIGPKVWNWARLFEARLSAGEHVLALGSAGVRPDCIFITASKSEPTDEIIKAAQLSHLTPEVRKLLKKSVVPIRPDWLDGAADYRLPAWYDGHRVQAHTRFGASHMKLDQFFRAAEGFREMGVDVFTRHIQAHVNGAWWPRTDGAVLPIAAENNIARKIIDNAHKQGCRILVYHVHMYDRPVSQEHPDWVCRNPQGKPIAHRTIPFLCYNSPYPEVWLKRALELVDMGADGFYFDFVHMPKYGCWCDRCRRQFKQATGLDHPRERDPDDPVWRKLVEFNNLTIEKTFLKWREALHRRNPELVMLISSHLWTAMTDHHLNNRLFRIADSVKMEFSIPIRKGPNRIFTIDKSMQPLEPDVRLGLGYTLARDAADGRPSHIWTHGLLDEASTLYATAGMVTHGCIANLDVSERTIPNMMFKRAFELGKKVSPHFAGTVPLRWAALHYSERARGMYAFDGSEQWQKVLYPLCGAYGALLRARLPVGIVTDSQLAEGLLDGYKLLFVPSPSHLTPAMRKAVAAFEKQGGLVVKQEETWLWHDSNSGPQAVAAFVAAVADVAEKAPVQVVGGPKRLHAVSFAGRKGNRLTVSLANEFSWVFTGRKPEADQVAELTKTPPPCRGVKVVIRGRGSPQKVFDAVSGKTLTARNVAGGVEVDVPDFEHMAVIVAEY